MSTKKLKGIKYQRQLNSNSKYNRVFSEDFKKQKVKEILEKRLTVKQVSDLYDVTRTAVYKWVYKYTPLEKGVKQVIEMESEALKTQALITRVAELERIVGQKQLEIDLLDKTLEIAGLELGYDLKKKYAPKSSKVIDKTR